MNKLEIKFSYMYTIKFCSFFFKLSFSSTKTLSKISISIRYWLKLGTTSCDGFQNQCLENKAKVYFFPPLNIWGTSLRYLSHTSDKYYPVAFSHGCKLLFPCCSTTYRRFMIIHIIPDGPCSFLALKERGKREGAGEGISTL